MTAESHTYPPGHYTRTPTAIVRATEADAMEGFSDPTPTLQPLSTDELIENLTRQVEALTKQQESIAAMLATVVEQVGPTLDKISDNPMFKMMFGGK